LGRCGSAVESTYIHGLLYCDCHAVVHSGLEQQEAAVIKRTKAQDEQKNSFGTEYAAKVADPEKHQYWQLQICGLVFGMDGKEAEECKRSELSLN
jgi:hypothetical protein